MTPRSARDMEAKKMEDDCCRAGPAMRATSTRMLVRKETEMISENTSPDTVITVDTGRTPAGHFLGFFNFDIETMNT